MELKDKLIELLKTTPTRNGGYCDLGEIAEHLIANGVTIPTRCKDCLNSNTVDCPLTHAGTYFVEADYSFCFWGHKEANNGQT